MRLRLLTSLAAALALSIPAGAAQGQLADERLQFVPAKITSGTGTVRLDGMGGFEAAVPDENFELNIFDFSGNPAGFSDDRDSWSIDLRYSHKELVQRAAGTPGEDLKINDGSLAVGFHRPGSFGLGGRVDYAEVFTDNLFDIANQYQLSGLTVNLNRYFLSNWSVGLMLGQSSETQDEFSSEVYKIAHEGTLTRGGLGTSLEILSGVVVGASGEVRKFDLKGESRGPFHTDNFDWERPSWTGSIHGAINRGRLHGAADYTRNELEGREDVRISWSRRFILNPNDEAVSATLPTFSEDRTGSSFRTRWRFDVVPGKISVGGAYHTSESDVVVVNNPNALGSLDQQILATTEDAVVGGASWIGLDSRLLAAAEFKIASSELVDNTPGVGETNTRDQVLVRLGGEYLLGESVAARVGLARSQDDLQFSGAGSLDGEINTTTLAVGLGIVPSGGIWQLDLSYDVDVDSDVNDDRSRFSAYVKYLF